MGFDFESLVNSFSNELEKKVEGVKKACRKACREMSDSQLRRYRDSRNPSDPCYDIADEELRRRGLY